jgi:penicillin amidase
MLHVRGLESEVRIGRDRFGVPRIEARSDADLAFGQGFCMGQDRPWQLEFYRRAAAGRMSEVAGADGLLTDRLMRTLGMRQAAEHDLDVMTAREAELLEAYAAGVTAAFAAAAAPPLECQLLRMELAPWRPVDTHLIGKVVALGFSTNMETELLRADLVERLGPELAGRLEPRYPSGNPITMHPGARWSGDAAGVLWQLVEARRALGLTPQPAGSNAWAVSGERSVTGRPLVAGDPHIAATIPCVCYAVELSSPDVELRGAAFPGFPGVAIGQTPYVAWGHTNVMADVQDLFVERVREGEDGRAPEYEFEGEWRPLTVRKEEIAVRGRPAEMFEVGETHHGPIVNGALGARRAEPLALAWTALSRPFFNEAMFDGAWARSGAELVEICSEYGVPALNMVWADSDGHIGYKLIGKLPIRRGDCPDVPKPGWTGEHEWDGYVPYDELPEVVDPSAGFLVSANNRVAPADYPHHITSDYLDGYRAARIEQLLAERERHSLDDFERMQLDVVSIPGQALAHRLTRLRPSGQREVSAIERVRSWDGRLDPDTVAGTIVQVFALELARCVSEAAIGDRDDAERWRSKSLVGFTPVNSAPWRFEARLIELWDEADPKLIGGRRWDDLVLEALSAALDRLERDHGADSRGWRWGRVHGIRFAHPMGEGEGLASRVANRLLSRRRPVGGAQETVNSTGYPAHDGDLTGFWGASFRLLADVGDPSRSRWQHMTGQSGHPGSPHYDDLVDGWVEGTSNPYAQPAQDTLTLRPS